MYRLYCIPKTVHMWLLTQAHTLPNHVYQRGLRCICITDMRCHSCTCMYTAMCVPICLATRAVYPCRYSLQYASEYRGTNEMFVFRVEPNPCTYRWAGLDVDVDTMDQVDSEEEVPRMFLNTARDRIAIGGGGGGAAIVLDDDLRNGFTSACSTFNSPPLCQSKQFECVAFEVWAFSETVDI
eukprot:m.73850 g.73850  ORF g.73850 m.73850 type:complete len:182 (+) comp8867_c0_seq1:23-568(+)